MSEDRFRDLSPADQKIRSLRRDGYLPVDRNGRLRVPLGTGPESQLVLATFPIQERRPPKPTAFISSPKIKSAWLAGAAANYNGWPLNTFVTIAWRVAPGVSDCQAEGFHHDLLKLQSAWCRDERKRVGENKLPPLAAIWTKEVGKHLGFHTHMLLHMPDCSYRTYLYWLKSAAHRLVGAPPVAVGATLSNLRLVHVSRVNPHGPDQDNVFAYMMKGGDPTETLSVLMDGEHTRHLIAEFLGIKPKFQGVVLGARVGNSGAIGPKAQTPMLRSFWDHSLQGAGLPSFNALLTRGELDRQLRGIYI